MSSAATWIGRSTSNPTSAIADLTKRHRPSLAGKQIGAYTLDSLIGRGGMARYGSPRAATGASKAAAPSRVRLFLDAVAAVALAHSHLIIHRDLKPSNVLVTRDGMVKLLDFGIAKLVNPERASEDATMTRAEEIVLTPEYAAPEQLLNDVPSTATDVYQLGMLLYAACPTRRALAIPISSWAARCSSSARQTRLAPPSRMRWSICRTPWTRSIRSSSRRAPSSPRSGSSPSRRRSGRSGRTASSC